MTIVNTKKTFNPIQKPEVSQYARAGIKDMSAIREAKCR